MIATEQVPELDLTGPLAIGEPVNCSNPVAINLTEGSTLHYLSDGTLQASGPDGSLLFTAREENAARMYIAGGSIQPVSRVIIAASEAHLDPVDAHTAEVSWYLSGPPILVIHDDSSLEPVFSGGVYYLDVGSSVAVGAGRTVIMTRPFTKPNPDVMYMREEYGRQARIEILCNGNSQDYTCTGLYLNNRTTNLSVSRALDFSVLPWMPDGFREPLLLSSEMTASIDPAGTMQYTLVTSSSASETQTNISSGIYIPHEHGGSPAVFNPENSVFSDGGLHTITHNYPLTQSGTYQARAYINFTVPERYAPEGNPRTYHLDPWSEMLGYTPDREEIPQ